ncbi:hypothetical protein [Lysinibacillus sp. NPDC059133]|uniref:hypothetical protein n=1 Tax=Lysinibacillus sp. NPDC059133 TaxID=3346737 RepID=UPI0036A71575
MKSIYLKFTGILLICVLLFQIVDVNFAGASENEKTENLFVTFDNEETSDVDFIVYQLPEGDIDNNITTQPRANKISVFFKGIVVGALTAGSIIYTTGKAPEEWVVMGLQTIEKKIKDFSNSNSYVPGKPIYVASNGNPYSCVVYPCAIANSTDISE